MKIAIPVWNGKISPVFDTASRLVVFDANDRTASPQYETFLDSTDLMRRCVQIKELEVDLLICGAISNHFGMMLSDTGIKIIPWIAGSAEEVLEAFFKGTLLSSKYNMPGRGMKISRTCAKKI